MGFPRAAIAALLLLGLLAAGCGERSRAAHGVVRDVQPEYGQVVIEHEEIPGLMSAMTMNFEVPDPALLERMERGQIIDFTVAFDGKSYRVTDFEVRGRESGGGGGTRLEDAAEAGDPAPEFSLSDQDGERLELSALRGKAVLLDFVYTSCSGPCPILTGTHVALQRALPAELRRRTWFVSISLDPERDSPEAMRAYARARGADLSDWSFLTGPAEQVDAVVREYGVGTVRHPDGQIEHLVITFLIDPEGRIARRYVGLEHGTEDLRRGLEGVL